MSISKHSGGYGYNALSHGSNDGGIPAVPVTPKQVNAIASLSETFRIGVEPVSGSGSCPFSCLD